MTCVSWKRVKRLEQLCRASGAADLGGTERLDRIQCLADISGPDDTRGAAESSRGGHGGLLLHACAVRCCRASYQNVSERRDRHSAVYRYNDYASTHYMTRLAVGIGLGLGLGSHGEP